MMLYRLIAVTLLLPSLALADERRCVVSFAAAQVNVCSGYVRLADPQLAALADRSAFAQAPVRVVKFEGPITMAQRLAVEAAGAEILGYAPYHAYIVRMPPALDSSMLRIDGVVWSGPFLPAWKIDVNLARDLGGARIIEQGGLQRISIGLHPGSSESAVRGALLDVPGLDFEFTEDAHDQQRLIARFAYNQLPAAVDQLARHPDVASINLRWDNAFMNSQAGWLHQSGVDNQRPIFDRGIYGCGQIVAAADTGLHATHCSFVDAGYGTPVVSVCSSGANCPAVMPDFNHRKIGAHYKWSGDSGSLPADAQGHGTHVMGSLAGNNPAGAVDCENLTTPGGNSNLDGTAPGAHLISQEMGASLQYINSLGGTLYHAATVAYGNGARIHNNSWGSSCRSQSGTCIADCQVDYRATTRDADRAVWDFPELSVFVAAGNSGSGCGPGADVGSPGNGKNVFSIGNNLRGTSGNSMNSGSSRGPTSDRRTKPDLAAQGSSIVSASRTDCGTGGMSGTSMASPTAAGLAALVREYLARGFYPSGIEASEDAITTPSSALIKALMINGALEITGTGSGGSAPSTSQGWGQVRLQNVLHFDGDTRNLWLLDQRDGLQTGDVDPHLILAEPGEPLIFTLTWHDFPATIGAMPHGVNQLRLEVEAPNGDVWTQKLNPGGGLESPDPFQGTSTVDYDDVNNVHQLRFDAPQAGIYQVRVRAVQVVMGGAQPYALVATGSLAPVPDFAVAATPAATEICVGDPASFEIGVLALFGFNDAVTLSVLGVPAPAVDGLTVNPVIPTDPAATSTLDITGTAGVAGGLYPLQVIGQSSGPTSDPTSRSVDVQLAVVEGTAAGGTLIAPADAAVDTALRPAFSWTAFANASAYRIEVSTDPTFASSLIDAVVEDASFTPSFALVTETEHFWRVAGINACGEGNFSDTFSFTTSSMICSTPAADIPDGDAEGLTDALMVTDNGALLGLRVSLDIEHTWVGDLSLTLSKGDTSVALVTRPGFTGQGFGCDGNDIRVTLDDDAILSIQNDCTMGANPTQAFIDGGDYRPANPLSAFSGDDLQGPWTLLVTDASTPDPGVLNGWCLLPELDPDHLFRNGFD